MTSEMRERIVMALVAAEYDTPQCRGKLACGEARCAVGVILERVFGVPPELLEHGGRYAIWEHPGAVRYDREVADAGFGGPHEQLVRANNSGASFDDCARIVKEWPVDDEVDA